MKTSIKELVKLNICNSDLDKLRKWYSDDEVFLVEDLIPRIKEIDDLEDLTWLITTKDKELGLKLSRFFSLEVIDLWDAPEIVVEFLKTGDKDIAAHAAHAARAVAHAAALATCVAAHAAHAVRATRSAYAADAARAVAYATSRVAAHATNSIKPFVKIIKENL